MSSHRGPETPQRISMKRAECVISGGFYDIM